MAGWQYQREESGYTPLAEGDYRIRVAAAKKTVAKSSGNDMLALEFDVSGKNAKLWHNISFLVDRPEITNRMLTQFFDGFKDIRDGDFNMQGWIGKVGACHVKHDDRGRAKISYFIRADKQDDLPPWKEPDKGASVPAMATGADGFMQVTEGAGDFIPF